MDRFPLGLIVLIIVSLLVFFGVAQRALDRMRLTDKGALVVILALIVGSFINVPIPGFRVPLEINIGGALVPIALAIYLLAKAGTGKEVSRALISAALTGVVIYFISTRYMSGLAEPAGGALSFVDPLYVFPIIAAVIAYVAGRSRRSAFIGATLGIILWDVANYYYMLQNNATNATKSIGGAGAFDTIVISGILAVLLADLIGETRERLQGGPASQGKPDALLVGLRKPEFERKEKKTQKENSKDKNTHWEEVDPFED
ncbi:transcriptional regulator, Fis family [Desulforamulus reducens MI-1]|uniref:Transcriptional regulator, Fis family n=1 Tax=Desulforamulus reducens (strain ATCC BAA-1160 / DSM 100696 / MI-1) TaxID=349161 RepID=A4J3N6_DESRM|nr:DUF1614 domain-containing protein [Desulforamulus reducens]ABO49689.1 transcriptional regulator, Fis family [Desulforamulus reducens MI-1]